MESGGEDNFTDRQLWNLGTPMSRTVELESSQEFNMRQKSRTLPRLDQRLNVGPFGGSQELIQSTNLADRFSRSFDQSKSVSVVVSQPKPMTDSEATLFEAEGTTSVSQISIGHSGGNEKLSHRESESNQQTNLTSNGPF